MALFGTKSRNDWVWNPRVYLTYNKSSTRKCPGMLTSYSSCYMLVNRLKNVEAASELGIVGLQFKSVDQLRQDLSHLGINIQTKDQLVVEERTS